MSQSETLHDHLKELRNRLVAVVLSLLFFSSVGYLIRNKLVGFIEKPFNSPLYYNTPAGSFNFIMKASFIFGLLFTIPIIAYNIIGFIQPALSKRLSRKYVNTVIAVCCLLAVSGAAFGFYIILPMSLNFFGSYSTKDIRPLISANEYLNYVLNIIIAFGLFFQIPLIIHIVDKIKPISPRRLLKYQKHIVVASIIIAVVLPFTYSPITQFVVAIPIVLLFYLSIAVLAISKFKIRRDKQVFDFAIDQPISQPEAVRTFTSEPVPTNYQRPVAITEKSLKYFDIKKLTAGTSDGVDLSHFKKQICLKPIRRTKFIDGFRPIIGSS